MTDELQPNIVPPANPETDNLRRVLRSVPPLAREGSVEAEIAAKVTADVNHHRSQCRSDAMTCVARARHRRNADLSVWTPDDVDTVYAIAELLMRLK